MSYIFFQDILEQLGHRIAYDGISNYAGNSFVEKSWDMIMEHNPMTLIQEGGQKVTSQNRGLVDLFGHLNQRNQKKS